MYASEASAVSSGCGLAALSDDIGPTTLMEGDAASIIRMG